MIKKLIGNSLLGILIFGLSYFLSSEIIILSRDFILWGVGAIIAFVSLFLLTFLSAKYTKTWMPTKVILVAALLGIMLFAFLGLPSWKFSTKVAPTLISLILGVLAGHLSASPGFRSKTAILMALWAFPFLLNLQIYSTWVHYIEFGTLTGKVQSEDIIAFEALDKAGQTVSNETLRGKVTVLDFWFIGCGPCWKKFPELQKVYDEYSTHPDFELYALNRPMSSDSPDQAFTSIEKKSYSFPVLKGSQKIMDDFDIYVYPTIIVLDRDGKKVFMGEIEDARAVIDDLLAN